MHDDNQVIHEYKGLWWLPYSCNKKIPGLLEFSIENGATLSLFGTFHEYFTTADFFNQELMYPPVILGTTFKNADITLYKCQEYHRTPSESTFYARDVFVGKHFKGKEEIKFRDIAVHYSHLDEWGNFEWFKQRDASTKEIAAIQQVIPEPIHIGDINNGKVYLDIHTSLGTVFHKEISVKQKTYIRFDFSEEKNFEDLMQIIHHMQNLLSLAMLLPICPLEIKANWVIRKEYDFNRPIDVFQHRAIPSIKKPRLIPDDMYFTFKDIKDNVVFYITNWFNKMELLEPICDLYFGSLPDPVLHLQHRFLCLAHALESYHRQVYKGEYQNKQKYGEGLCEKFIEVIPNTLDDSFKKSLKSRLQYLNEYSLRKRAIDILKKCPKGLVNNLIGQDFKVLIEKLVTTRNYLTHFDESSKKGAAFGNVLYLLTRQLSVIIEICLLKEIGFKDETIQQFVSKNRYYLYLVRDIKSAKTDQKK